MTKTLDTIRRAEGHDGASDPRATELRKSVWKQYDEAKAFAADGDNTRASSMLARAEADAELALAVAEKMVIERQIAEIVARLEELRRQPPGARTPK